MTILAESTVPQWTWLSIAFLVILIGACIFSIFCICEDENYVLAIGIAFVIVSCVIFCNSLDKTKEIKVTISEDYPAKALLENYKIVNIEGEIYTLKEKEKKENE